MSIIAYDRKSALEYARIWAFKRNPKYYNFDLIGGDCTNFISQCIYAGAKTMNFTPVVGWYYNSSFDRTPSWTGVKYLYDFLTRNNGAGPFAELVTRSDIKVADIIQLGRDQFEFYHTLFVTGVDDGNITVAAHSADAFNVQLERYRYNNIRYIHIKGVRQ